MYKQGILIETGTVRWWRVPMLNIGTYQRCILPLIANAQFEPFFKHISNSNFLFSIFFRLFGKQDLAI